MFNEVLSFLRFVADPETRKTIATVSTVVSKALSKNYFSVLFEP